MECEQCGATHYSEWDAADCCPSHECPSCGGMYFSESEADDCCGTSFHGDVPALQDIPVHEITVPVIEGRPARLCSLEQEVADGGAVIARLLYEEGWSGNDYIQSYHSSGSGGGPGSVHVEEDGSLPVGWR